VDTDIQLTKNINKLVHRVLLVSALPPPAGGVSTLTQMMKDKGLPNPFLLSIVDTRVSREHPTGSTRINFAELKRTLRILKDIYMTTRSENIAVMHLACSLKNAGAIRNWASARIAKHRRVPYVAQLHSNFRYSTGRGLIARYYRWAYRSIFNGASKILPLNVPSYNSVIALGDYASKTEIIPNFVDFEAIPQRGSQPRAIYNLKLSYVGALLNTKGVLTILEVMKRLPGVEICLIGAASNESSSDIKTMIETENLGNRVKIVGEIPRRDVLIMLSESDVYLFPSKSVGF